VRAVIVGAGVAGLSCAISAALNDVEAVVLDKKRRIGEPVRSTGGIAKRFLLEAGLVPDLRFMYGLKRVIISSPGAECEITAEGRTLGYVMDQEAFENHLARMAERLGVEIRLESPVRPEDLGRLRREYDFLVGADGPYSTVRRALGIPDNGSWDMHRGLELWVRGRPRTDLENAIMVRFDHAAAPYGYVWLFRYNDMVKYGAGVPIAVEKDLKATLYGMIDQFFDGWEVVNHVGGVIPTPKPLGRVSYGNMALIGDAGNFVNAATGGGIQLALLSGKSCGEAMGRGSLKHYERWYRRSARPFLSRWYRIKRFLYSLGPSDMDRLLRAFSGFRVASMDPRKEIPRAVRHVALRDFWLLVKLVKAWWSA
jgi:digeranylgeranylglycerophospholipid reductase